MKKIILICVCFSLCSSISWAEKIYLIDGSVYNGTIIKKNADNTVVRIKGQVQRISNDEIASIGEPLDNQFEIDSSLIGLASDKKLKLIYELLEIGGTRENLEKHIVKVIDSLPDEEKEKVERALTSEKIMAKIVPVFNQYYTEEELGVIIEFQRSSAGKKMKKHSADIMKECINEVINFLKDTINPL